MGVTDKRALRGMIAQKKRAMTATGIRDASSRLAERFFETEAYKCAQSVYAYMSFNQEVDTRPIIRRAWADGKRVAVPKVVGREMIFIWIDDFDHLEPSAFGVPEPIEDASVADDPDALVLMPGLAFDKEGRRIGYGGGYYDRFLSRETAHPTIALCFDFQYVEHISSEAHDIPVDLVLADSIP